VAPPRTGKTTLLLHIAEGAIENYGEDLHLMILLVDERPEEVTEFKRALPQAEIFASSNDSNVRDHCRMAELAIERAKRLVEAGKHVLILLDSITRLARAYNNAERGSGRTMSGGIDARALETPRRLFAAARNTRGAGSLTILATALVETNSRMDDLIFQEFKGTGNMELVLNRRVAEMYIYPAVDILKSGTRREELILPELWLEKVRLIRRGLANHKPTEAMERLLFFLKKCHTNAQLMQDLKAQR
jgi:transcription termination factor Rho